MERITRRIGESVDFVDGKNYATLSHEEKVRLLFNSLADCEDKLEEKKIIKAYFEVEDFLYGKGKDIPLETKAAMLWGALTVICNAGELPWERRKVLFGEFMSKQLNLS